jgi:hypothetical protein
LIPEELEQEVMRLKAQVDSLTKKLEQRESRRRIDIPSLLRERLLDPAATIVVSDSIQKLSDETVARILGDKTLTAGTPFSGEELQRRLDTYWQSTSALLDAYALGLKWGTDQHAPIWRRALERVANAEQDRNGTVVWLQLRHWPALLLMYGGGLIAVAAQNWSSLRSVVVDPIIDEYNDQAPAVVGLTPTSVLDPGAAQRLDGYERRYTPVSDYLHERLRDYARFDLPEDSRYDRAFDFLELMLALIYVDVSAANSSWVPIGRFGWRRRHNPSTDPLARVRTELDRDGASWAPLTAGLFGGSVDRAEQALEVVTENMTRVSGRWF